MTKLEIDSVNKLLSRLSNHEPVNSAELSTLYLMVTGVKFKGTRCVPCIKKAMAEMRNAMLNIKCSDCEEELLEKTIVKSNGRKK